MLDFLRKDATVADVHVSNTGGTGKGRGKLSRAMRRLQESIRSMVTPGSIWKAGARHSGTDLALIQMVHDAAIALGAECDDDEDGADNDLPAATYVKRDTDWSIPVEIAKVDEDKNLVFGWANVVHKDGAIVVDSQGDQIDIGELEDAVYGYVLHKREAGEMHDRVTGVGKMVESLMMTVEKQKAMGLPVDATHLGWWVGYRLEPDVFAKVRSGEYSMFSIGGAALRVPAES